jgi:hypothetical protein
MSDPRVAVEADHIRLAFRYGCPPWSTVITIDFRAWLPTHEPNVVALELQRLRAGALPIVAQSLLERVSEAARRNDIEVRWFRHNGHPVALLRFQAAQPRPTAKLQRLELQAGRLVVGGRALEDAPLGGKKEDDHRDTENTEKTGTEE